MDTVPDILPMHKRRYEEIPVDTVKVINSRNRDEEQFTMNVDSIDNTGLLKPIRVNDKFHDRSGLYELICGEGRLLAHQRLKQQTILAEVITCTRKEAYLQSLVENIARTKPGSMDFARELNRLHDEGWDHKRIALIAGKSETYIRDLIRLVQQGEERLVDGVDRGVFPMKFAIQIVSTDDAQMQHVLMDAFDEGMVTTNNFAQARRIIVRRSKESKKKTTAKKYSVNELRQDIVDVTKEKASYVREAKTKENRFMTLLSGINSVWSDAEFLKILGEENLADRPGLLGDFAYES